MSLSDEVLDHLTRNAALSADTVVTEMREKAWYTNAQITRAAVRRAIESLAANDLIRIPDPPTDPDHVYIMDPPFTNPFSPERRPIINKFHNFEDIEVTDAKSRVRDAIARSENDLCECDRPDTLDDPHRHTLTVACIYWMAGRPSQADRLDACRQLNLPDVGKDESEEA